MVAAPQQTPRPQRSQRFDLRQMPKQQQKPLPRLVIVGEPGIGKTTFGASAPNAILIATEDGALGIDVPRLPISGKCETFDEVLEACRVLRDEQHEYKWVVLDTANGAEHLCAQMVCDRDFGGRWNTTKNNEGYNAFGKGEKATAEEFRQLLVLLDQLQQRRGMGVILLSHVGLQRQGNALGADFMKFTGEMGKSSWSLVCSWADQVGHACREIRAAKDDGDAKNKAAKAYAINNERWLVFEGGPARDAKSRAGYEMPEKILFSWDEYWTAMEADKTELVVAQALAMLKDAPEGARKVVAQRLGGEISADRLRGIGKAKVEQLVGWLLAKTEG